jgi:hypothetical protein
MPMQLSGLKAKDIDASDFTTDITGAGLTSAHDFLGG